MTIPTLIFDLDNTLYPSSCRLFDQIDQRMTQYVSEYLDLPKDEARTLQKHYFHHHGTTLSGLMEKHGTDPHHFLSYVHDIDLSPMDGCLNLRPYIEAYQGKKFIYTNGSVGHAENILGYLGIADLFEDTFDIIASKYKPKPDMDAFHAMLKQFDVDAKNCIMIDDIPRNLEPAAKLGMRTIWINEEDTYAHLTATSGADLHTYIHETHACVGTWLQTLNDKRDNNAAA